MASHEPLVPVGWSTTSRQSEPVRLRLSTVLRNILVTGTTGWGKSGLLLSLMLWLLTQTNKTSNRLLADFGVTALDYKGETADFLTRIFLPSLCERFPHLGPSDLVVIRPFASYGTKLNPLARTKLDPPIQAAIVTGLLDGLVEQGFGPRMKAMLGKLTHAGISMRGTFLDILRILTREGEAQRIASRVPDPELRDYLENVFDTEPQASKDALRARLEWLLTIPSIRAMLTADTSISGEDILESRVAVIDVATGVPQGFQELARFIGSYVFAVLTGAVFSRSENAPHRMIVADEWHELVKNSSEDVARLISQARFRKVNLVLANQSLAQISEVSPTLTRSLLANISVHAAFRPSLDEVKHVLPLLSVTGTKVDPEQPDRLLSPAVEKARLIDRWSRMPPRHALLADFAGSKAEVIRTLDVPYDEATRRSRTLAPALLEAFARGRFGIPIGDLIKPTPIAPSPACADADRPPASDPPARRSPKRRVKLVLP